MAKTKDKNKIMLIISAMLIVIAVIITCVATIYEKTSSNNNKTSEIISGADGPAVSTTKAPTLSTTAPQTTAPQVSKAENKAGKYKVNTKDDPLGIRIDAAQDAQRISEIPKGTEIEILAVYDTWGYVNFDGVGGWVSMNYVELVSASTETSKHTTGKYKIATKDDPLGIRTKPEQDAERSGEIPKGEEVEILAVCGDWGYVKYESESGWLSFQYLEKVS